MNNTKATQLLKSRDGFTLTELMIVIAILAGLMALVGPNLISKFNKSKVENTKIQMRQLGVVLDDFKRECNFYPLTDQGLNALISKPSGGRECKNYDPEGYLKAKAPPKDAWGNDFNYASDGSKYELKSLGEDGQEGGENYAKDISSADLE